MAPRKSLRSLLFRPLRMGRKHERGSFPKDWHGSFPTSTTEASSFASSSMSCCSGSSKTTSSPYSIQSDGPLFLRRPSHNDDCWHSPQRRGRRKSISGIQGNSPRRPARSQSLDMLIRLSNRRNLGCRDRESSFKRKKLLVGNDESDDDMKPLLSSHSCTPTTLSDSEYMLDANGYEAFPGSVGVFSALNCDQSTFAVSPQLAPPSNSPSDPATDSRLSSSNVASIFRDSTRGTEPPCSQKSPYCRLEQETTRELVTEYALEDGGKEISKDCTIELTCTTLSSTASVEDLYESDREEEDEEVEDKNLEEEQEATKQRMDNSSHKFSQKLMVVLLDPILKIYEVVQVPFSANNDIEVTSLTSTLKSVTTNTHLSKQTYVGLSYKGMQVKTKIALMGIALASELQRTPLVGIPKGYSANQVDSLARELLSHPRIARLIDSQWDVPGDLLELSIVRGGSKYTTNNTLDDLSRNSTLTPEMAPKLHPLLVTPEPSPAPPPLREIDIETCTTKDQEMETRPPTVVITCTTRGSF